MTFFAPAKLFPERAAFDVVAPGVTFAR